jgi:hypothetical protein
MAAVLARPVFNTGGFFLIGVIHCLRVGDVVVHSWFLIAPTTGTSAPASAEVRTRLKLSDDTLVWVQARLDGLKIPTVPNDRRAQIASACWRITIERSQSIVMFVHQGLYGPARGVMWPLFEAYVRGLWLRFAATDHQVDDAEHDRFPNDFGQLVSAVESTGHVPPGFLAGLKTTLRSWLCRPHTGYQQTGAPLTIDGLGYGNTDDEIVEALNWADGIALMTVVAFAQMAKDESLRRDAEQRLKSF